jgi:nitroimidazol reductase NimA-like FMN-containing flavoprotein (pyridoxamine 5'-phosphate oxidase superfamily)
MVPLSFARENDVLWLHSAGEGRKLDCLYASPQVCVEAERFIDLRTGADRRLALDTTRLG